MYNRTYIALHNHDFILDSAAQSVRTGVSKIQLQKYVSIDDIEEFVCLLSSHLFWTSDYTFSVNMCGGPAGVTHVCMHVWS